MTSAPIGTHGHDVVHRGGEGIDALNSYLGHFLPPAHLLHVICRHTAPECVSAPAAEKLLLGVDRSGFSGKPFASPSTPSNRRFGGFQSPRSSPVDNSIPSLA